MKVLTSLRQIVLLPIWLLQLGSAAKSFVDNPILGSSTLNRWGLHSARVRLAGAMSRWRRRRLAGKVRADWREAFDRDGFVVIRNVIPAAEFDVLRRAILGYRGPAREMRQGNALTRRLAVDPPMLAAIPKLRDLLARADLKALFHYVSSYRIEPLHYIQAILTHDDSLVGDPQEELHADTFHCSLKAWYFLNAVEADAAPFTFVPGSHVISPRRTDWEYRRSIRALSGVDRLSARGSPRIGEADLAEIGLPPPRAIAVPANTLVVADTFGFHARGASSLPVERVELWSYSRRNPFLPWIGGDFLSLPGLAERRVRWLWGARDRFERLVGQPWRPVGVRRPVDRG